MDQWTNKIYISNFTDAPLDKIPVHVRGGVIFPLQFEAKNTELSRANPWIFLVALDDSESASGEVFMDDGVTLDTISAGTYFKVGILFIEISYDKT